MREAILWVGAGALVLAIPASAAGIADEAKAALSSGSLLKKAEANCGASAKLSKKDALALTFARAAAEQALPISEFQTVDRASEDEAMAASQAPGFCAETKRKRSALVSRVRKAGKALIAAKTAG